MLNLTLWLSAAIGFLSWLLLRRVNAVPLLSDQEARERIARADLGDIPDALKPAPPRPDVFSRRGYLRQRRYQDLYLPLLLRGRVARALVLSYRSEADSPGVEATFEYAWIDHLGALKRVRLTQYFEGLHHDFKARGEICIALDAPHIRENEPLTIVYAEGDDVHVVYDALKIEELGLV